jgi:DNA-binding NtrC family response regulator
MKEKILLVDDDNDVLYALKILLVSEDFEVGLCQTPASAVALLASENFSLVLMDLNYSLDTTSGDEGLGLITAIRKLDEDLPIVVMTGWATIEVAVSTMQNGANDFIQKPWDIDRLIAVVNNQIKLANSVKHSNKLSQQNQLLQQQVNSEFSGELIANSAAMQKTMTIIKQVASSSASVLLTGENGTGKSMFARYLHQHSEHKQTNQISVNMGAVTEALFESEMFGHVKGAFTDAKSTRIGRFELADGGTLFLDEIANTPYSQQGKLLRVLEDGEFEKVGSNKTISVAIRLISATNANLDDAVARNEFRKDLLYRINTVTIEIPPLRDRRDDIIPLAESFLLKAEARNSDKKYVLTATARKTLLEYDWPGNIRELSHVIERAQILCQNQQIKCEDLGLPIAANVAAPSPSASTDLAGSTSEELPTFKTIELDVIDQRLRLFDGNALKAAKSLGLSRSAFYRRLEKL